MGQDCCTLREGKQSDCVYVWKHFQIMSQGWMPRRASRSLADLQRPRLLEATEGAGNLWEELTKRLYKANELQKSALGICLNHFDWLLSHYMYSLEYSRSGKEEELWSITRQNYSIAEMGLNDILNIIKYLC